MNLKLNLKVLAQMREDLLSLSTVIAQVQDPAVKERLGRELLDKVKAVDTLYAHYKKVLDRLPGTNQE